MDSPTIGAAYSRTSISPTSKFKDGSLPFPDHPPAPLHQFSPAQTFQLAVPPLLPQPPKASLPTFGCFGGHVKGGVAASLHAFGCGCPGLDGGQPREHYRPHSGIYLLLPALNWNQLGTAMLVHYGIGRDAKAFSIETVTESLTARIFARCQSSSAADHAVDRTRKAV